MWFPSWLEWYKKPEYRDIKEYSTEVRTGARPLSPDGRNKNAIPKKLKLEKILQNKTCSPMSLYDFYMYLKYIEYSAENLEFYIWYKNYENSYARTGSIRELDDGSSQISSEKPESQGSLDLGRDPELANETIQRIAELLTPEAICSASGEGKCNEPCQPKNLSSIVNTKISCDPICGPDTTSMGIIANLPASGSGQRAELNAVVQTFLVPESAKELNIPPAMRDQALAALENSSDPVHLAPIADHVYQLLRNCSHRNFVRLGICNGTIETICMATGLGIVLTISGFLFMFMRAFWPQRGTHSRWDTFGAWPLWWLGLSLIFSGTRGSCFFLLLFSRRQPLPWERFDDSASMLSRKSGIMRAVSRLMIIDRKIRVKDIHLRRLQNKIVIQSLVSGALFATMGVLLFIFLPVWSQTVRR